MATEGSFVVPAGRRLSRVDSKTLRESFSGEASAEMEAVMRNLARKDDKIKYNRRMRVVLAGAIGVMVVMVGAMFAVTLSANEATKESHVKDSALVGKNGAAVQTDIFVNYASVFDLARFDAQTIVKTKKIALILENGEEAAFEITGAKKRPGSLQATFLTPGGHIVVDSAKMEATATVNCRTYKVAAPADVQERRLAELDQSPRLFAERHLAIKDGKASGWAAVAVALAQAVQDKMDGKDMVSGSASGESDTGDKVDLFYQFNIGSACDAKMTEIAKSDDKCGAVDKCQDTNEPGKFAMFAYTDKEEEAGKGIRAVFFDNEGTFQGTIPVEQHGRSVVDFTVTSCDDTAVDDVKLETVSSDPRSTPKPMMMHGLTVDKITRDDTVTKVLSQINIVNGKTFADACKKIAMAALDGPEGETKEERDRRLREMNRASLKRYTEHFDKMSAELTHEEIEKHPMRHLLAKDANGRRLRAADTLADDAYGTCTIRKGNACVIQEGCKFAFRGSDDFRDWLANGAGVFYNQRVNGKQMHGGFVAEIDKLRSTTTDHPTNKNSRMGSDNNLDRAVSSCSNPHWIGHSLGGAMATVAREHYGKGYVTTFGAPQCYDDKAASRHGDRCHLSQTSSGDAQRYYDERDPVAGNLYGALLSYWHGQKARELTRKCSKRNWWGTCKKYKYNWKYATCIKNSGTWDVNFGAHSMAKNYKKHYTGSR